MKNNTTSAFKFEAKSVIDAIQQARWVSGYGGYHTARPDAKNPKPYGRVTYNGIIDMVKNPCEAPKEQAQWAIFSTTNGPQARVHQFQRENGQYLVLWGDLDQTENLTFLDIVNRVNAAFPQCCHVIYTTKSATKDNPKARILLPLAENIPGHEYEMFARIFNNRLEASGLPPDRATERTGQLCYLPNRGAYYNFQINDGSLIDPYTEFKNELIADQARLKEERKDRERRHQEAIKRTQERIDTGQTDPIEAFRQAYPVDLALERYGYQRHGKKYLSPLSESGKPGVTILDNKWCSHHSSDAVIGQSKDGSVWGDSFDLFVYYEHGGDFSQAVQCAGDLFTVIDQATGERISITKANQRAYMRQQDTQNQTSGEDAGQPSTENDDWNDPVPLDDNTPPDMDQNILTGPLGDMARAVSAETETPIELGVGIGLSVLATACQGKITIQVKPGYREPLNIWVVVALDPANRKTSVLSKMTAPLSLWEREQHKQMEPQVKEAQSRRQNQESRIKSLRAKYGKAKSDELKEIEAEIFDIENNFEEIPALPKVWAQDVTPEHLGTLMARHNEQMSILSAEGGIFDIAAGRYSNGVPNLDLFLQGHAGDSVRVDRGSRESVFLDHPALTFGLSPQPGVLRGLANKPGFRSRGLLARFMYLLPISNLGYRTLETTQVPEPIKANYHNLIFQLLNIETKKNEHGEMEPHVLTLSKAAYKEWADFYMAVEKELRDDGRFEHIRDWAGKLPGAAARIVGLLHCEARPLAPWTIDVHLKTMETALDLVTKFADHALIAFDLMGADKSLDGARKVWRWVKKNRFVEFTKRDCFKALESTFHRVVNIEDPLKALEERNYIRANTEKTGGRPSIKYAVNPKITQGWF